MKTIEELRNLFANSSVFDICCDINNNPCAICLGYSIWLDADASEADYLHAFDMYCNASDDFSLLDFVHFCYVHYEEICLYPDPRFAPTADDLSEIELDGDCNPLYPYLDILQDLYNKKTYLSIF